MNTEVDVLIIGGGPAGLAASIVFGRNGLRTMLCDKRSLPADKACGEGIMPTGVAHLERLGITPHLLHGNHFPIEGIRYVSPRGSIASADFREGPGLGIPRLELSRALLRTAKEVDCLEIRTQVQATPIQKDDGHLSVRVGNDHIRTRLLVGADGLNSIVRQWAGLQGSRGKEQRWGARQHFQITPWSRKVEVHWSDGLEAYITPCGENLIGVAFLWDRTRHPRLPGGIQLLPALLDFFPLLKERVKDVPVTDAPLAIGPMQRSATRPIADGVLLIGDAAGYLDALTGEGLSLAFAQALSLEETIVPMLRAADRKDLISIDNLLNYEKSYKRIMQPYYRVTKLVLWLSHHPIVVEQAIKILRRKPALFQSLLSASMGLIPLWQVPLQRSSAT